ncbi:lipoprotein-releasing ABC transporter permease subunit [Wohlfahrtiimonas chitiniclastica]|uniref:lipoprotein-releasing ABC transporter permease subunit n=1 Tax=Wohlfahrtiimonas chitiniclastica TaxID=400946 RepID=UPI00200A91CF|nr:lipoprotein-releasing ABC transporter permease subunit [Wohlfahrtiimonas chitiniclastica]
MMFRPLSLYIGLRYTRAQRKKNFISFISFISIGGIALGMMTMIVVLSVMNGFQNEVKARNLAMAYDIAITDHNPQGFVKDWENVYDAVRHEPNVIAGAPFNNGEGLLAANGQFAPIKIQGVDPLYEEEVSTISDKITADFITASDFSILQPGEFGIILGTDLALSLGASVGDHVTLITPKIQVTAAGAIPRMKRLKVVGIFRLGQYEYDATMGIMHASDSGRIYQIPKNSVSGVRLKLTDPMIARETAERLQQKLGDDYRVSTWIDEFKTLFKMIEIEKLTMFTIMSLIVAVAVFNVVSTLVMVVTEKRPEIAILRTLGMSPMQIMVIFMVQGTFIGFFGALIGMGLGLLIAFNVNHIVSAVESFFGSNVGEAFYVLEIPSEVVWSDIYIVAGIAFGLASLATLYPAWKAAQTQPAEALRYD